VGITLAAFRGICAALLFAFSGGCAVIPDVPPDFALPVRAIVAQASCELRDAFIVLDQTPQFKRFKAKQWLVTITLLPRTEVGLTASGGLTRRTLNNPVRFTTWALSGPGVQLDDKGIRSSGISYNFVSGALMADRTLMCPPDYPSIHVLAQHLNVGRWLFRSADTLSVAASLSADKPVYNSQITIRLAANGSYTFTFPAGTDLASLSGSYSLDEQLNISMAPIADKETLSVTSLPTGKQYRSPVTSTVQVQAAQTRLDIQGLETAIRQLQTR
jgi:hypothetical protein